MMIEHEMKKTDTYSSQNPKPIIINSKHMVNKSVVPKANLDFTAMQHKRHQANHSSDFVNQLQ